jgi:hypothetical protein
MSGGACVIIIDSAAISATVDNIGVLVNEKKIKNKDTIKAGVSCLKKVKEELDEFLNLVQEEDDG